VRERETRKIEHNQLARKETLIVQGSVVGLLCITIIGLGEKFDIEIKLSMFTTLLCNSPSEASVCLDSSFFILLRLLFHLAFYYPHL